MPNIKISDPRIEAIREKYGLEPSDFWELPQAKGRWCVKHSALETVAAKADIMFDAPQIIEADSANGVAVLAVVGYTPGRREWSTGEASPKNNKNAYPWAMAEKRAKDRVILKLAGLQGLLNSDAEMDVEPPHDPVTGEILPREAAIPDTVVGSAPITVGRADARPHYDAIAKALSAAETLKQLQGAWERNAPIVATLPTDWQLNLVEHKDSLKDSFLAKIAATP